MTFSDEEVDQLDWKLLQKGAVNLFWRMELYENAIQALQGLNYRVIRLRFENFPDFRDELSLALFWEEQFGYFPWNGNLDALNDGFREQPFLSSEKTAVCLENFQKFITVDRRLAEGMLDILERTSRDYLLFGRRLITLVQTTDSRYACNNIGCNIAHWNDEEWLDSNRGL